MDCLRKVIVRSPDFITPSELLDTAVKWATWQKAGCDKISVWDGVTMGGDGAVEFSQNRPFVVEFEH